MAPAVLRHRLVLRPEAELERVTPRPRWRRRSRRSRCRGDADAARRRRCSRSARPARSWPAGRSRPCSRRRSSAAAAATRCARAARPRSNASTLRVVPRGVAGAARGRAARAAAPLRVRQALPADVTLEPQEGEGDLRVSWSPAAAGATCCRPSACARPGRSVSAPGITALGGEAELLVYPDLVGARRLALAARRGQLPESGRRARGAYGLGTAFEAVRDYAPDDDVRQINWRATARLGRPMSNQYRIDQDREVRCLLDAGRLSAAACAGGTLLDVALDGLDRGLRDRRRARRPQRRAGVRRSRAARRRALAARRRGRRARALRRRARRQRQRLRARVPQRRRRQARPSCSCSPTSSTRLRRAPLVAAVPVLARRHAVCVASVRDDALDGLLTRHPAAICATPTR